MGYSKREFITDAYGEIGLASYVFDLSAEDWQTALRKMDAMMATWNGKGIRLGYPLPTSPSDSDLDEQTSVPDSANEAIITNLAIRLAPGVGKAVSPQTLAAAKAAYDVLMARAAMPSPVQLPSMPYGAGNKPTNGAAFFPDPTPTLDAGPDGELTYE